MEELLPLFYINLLGFKIGISISMIIQWIIIFFVGMGAIIFSKKLKKIPDKKQTVIEVFVTSIDKLVEDTMGKEYKGFVPFIGTLIIILFLLNMSGLFGVEPPTAQYSVSLGYGIITFIVIQAYTIKKIGIKHYFIGYAKPISVLMPLNIIERIMLPVSLSLRLFGNMTAAAVIMSLLYEALGSIGFLAQIGVPVPLHFYFDIFDGTIQTIIFIMLTMINIKIISEH